MHTVAINDKSLALLPIWRFSLKYTLGLNLLLIYIRKYSIVLICIWAPDEQVKCQQPQKRSAILTLMELAHIRCGGACFCISRKSKMKKEQSQDYPFVITYLSNRYRLIECRDHIQWILQRRDKNVPRWRGIYYFLNTQSMSRIFRQFDLDNGVVGQLPERFESRFKTVQREQIKSDDIVPGYRQKTTRGQKFFWAAWREGTWACGMN